VTFPVEPARLLGDAREDYPSVVELAGELVRVPSRGGIDPYEPVLGVLDSWLEARGLEPATLKDDGTGEPVGLVCEVDGGGSGPRWVLDACLDTAPFGDEAAWSQSPTAGVVRDGWLWGRGASDSKAAAAIFCHIGARLAAAAERLAGRLVLLFDVDEHTGRFGGARRYFGAADSPGDVAGVLIGYPGFDELVVGSRGVLRAQVRVHGIAGHSGARAHHPNAIEKAAVLVRALSGLRVPVDVSPRFPLPPKLTVTAIRGGEGYSISPDGCDIAVDVRTTPTYGLDAARRAIGAAATELDADWPGTPPTEVVVETSWPAYALEEGEPVRDALLQAASAFGVPVRPKVSGPSNIGNYLATLGIPATAGWGVAYRGLHGTDEAIDLSTVPMVQAVYHAAVLRLLSRP
jgi:succinyl-diaminopimelate desuccinylase